MGAILLDEKAKVAIVAESCNFETASSDHAVQRQASLKPALVLKNRNGPLNIITFEYHSLKQDRINILLCNLQKVSCPVDLLLLELELIIIILHAYFCRATHAPAMSLIFIYFLNMKCVIPLNS